MRSQLEGFRQECIEPVGVPEDDISVVVHDDPFVFEESNPLVHALSCYAQHLPQFFLRQLHIDPDSPRRRLAVLNGEDEKPLRQSMRYVEKNGVLDDVARPS